MRLALAALFLVSTGCYAAPPWHGDESFTASERADIERAQTFMADRVGVESVGIVWDRSHSEGTCEPGTIVRRANGLGGQRVGSCIYLGLAGGNPLDALVAHEFGHHHGLVHVDDEGVMNSIPMAMTWTEADQVMCVSRGLCQ